MPQDFSKVVLENLLASGWYPGRDVPIHLVRQRLLEEFEMCISDHCEAFLREFYGLRFHLRNGVFAFDIDEAILWISRPDIPFLRFLSVKEIYPVGYGGRRIAFFKQDGGMLLLNDEWMFFNDFERLNDALEDVFNPGRSLKKAVILLEHEKPPSYRESTE